MVNTYHDLSPQIPLHTSHLRMSCVCSRTASELRHNGRDGVSIHQSHQCLLNRLLRRRSKKTSKLRVTGLCEGNSPVTNEFPVQRSSNAENVSIWWQHHGLWVFWPCHKGHALYFQHIAITHRCQWSSKRRFHDNYLRSCVCTPVAFVWKDVNYCLSHKVLH